MRTPSAAPIKKPKIASDGWARSPFTSFFTMRRTIPNVRSVATRTPAPRCHATSVNEAEYAQPKDAANAAAIAPRTNPSVPENPLNSPSTDITIVRPHST